MGRETARYIRVSTKEQAENSNALKQQEKQLSRYKCDRAYCDVQSGTEEDRIEFQKLWNAIAQKEISILYVRDMSRLARDGFVSIKFLELLKETETKLYVVYSERFIDLHDPDDFYKVCNEGLLAQRESAVLSKRIKRGIEANRNRKVANSRPPFGYARVEEKYDYDYSLFEKANTKITKIDYAKEVIKTVLEVESFNRTEKILRDKYGTRVPFNLNLWIRNPVLRGFTGYGITPGTNVYREIHETHSDKAILTSSEYALINSRAKKNIITGVVKERQKLFTARVWCDRCGYKMTATAIKGEEIVRCHYGKRSQGCDQPSIMSSTLWKLVSDRLLQQAQDFLDKAIALEDVQIEDPRITEIKNKIKKLQKVNDDGFLNDKIAELEQGIYRLEIENRKPAIDREKLQQDLLPFVDPFFFETLSFAEKREILDLYVEKISLNGKEVNIKVLFNP